MSLSLQWPLETRGITRVMVHPVWTIVRSRLNIKWNGKTRQNVVGLTFGSTIHYLLFLFLSDIFTVFFFTFTSHILYNITFMILLSKMILLCRFMETVIYHLPTDNVSNSAIIGFDTTPGPDVSVMRNCTWSHSLLVFTICMSTSVPCSFFATVCSEINQNFFHFNHSLTSAIVFLKIFLLKYLNEIVVTVSLSRETLRSRDFKFLYFIALKVYVQKIFKNN